METMKIIDLYVKIANGEIKDKTKFRIYWGDMYRDFYYDGSEKNQLQCLKNCSDDYSLYDDIKLNDEVEIIEDTPKEDNIKEILSLNTDYYAKIHSYVNLNKEEICLDIQTLKHKPNEIIDKINGE